MHALLIPLARIYTAAVIVLRESLASNSIFVNEGSNLTACATIVYTYGDLPLASSHSLLFTIKNRSVVNALARKALGVSVLSIALVKHGRR